MRCVSLLAACALTVTVSLICTADDMNGDKKTPPKTVTVTMKSLSYDPKKLEILVGDSVVWSNTAFAAHTTISDDEGKTFDTGEIKPGESSKPVKFESEGEFKYHCKTHGKSMSGTIIVKPRAK